MKNELTEYLHTHVVPKVAAALRDGEDRHTGENYWNDQHVWKRTRAQDIDHVRRCHVDVRLLEAEDVAEQGDWYPLAAEMLHKIESAIGYLVILHKRLQMRILGEDPS